MNSSIAKVCAHIVVATLAAGLSVNHAWAATPDDEAKSVVVRYTDLDLSRPKDVSTLYHRLQTAARLVCSEINLWSDDLTVSSQYYRCVQKAMAHAVASVGSERLTEISSRYNR